MKVRTIILLVIGMVFISGNMYGWFIWDLYQVYDDTDKKVLMESGYKMYEFNTLSKSSDGTSSITKHDVFYDWYRAHLILSEKTMNREQQLELGDYLRINYSPLVFKKKVNGVAYSFSARSMGKLSLAVSRESSPGSRGAEVSEDASTLLMGARYENQFEKIDLKLIKFNDLKLGLSFANSHNEKYDSPGTGIFRLNVDSSLSPNLYLWIGDSDTSDGDGGQIFEIKYICYDDSNNVIKSIYFHTPASSSDTDTESDYLYVNTGSVDSDHRFADMSSSIVYALPVPVNTKKIYLIIKTGGVEKLYKISSDNINYVTIDNSILPDNDYCNIIITDTGLSYDNSISISSSATYDDSILSASGDFKLSNILSSEIYNVSGNTALGLDWDTKITFPYIGDIIFKGEFGYSIEKRIYYTSEKNITGKAYNFKVSYGFEIPAGLFEIGTLQWMMDNNYNASFSVDSRKDYTSIEFYTESGGSGIPLGKDIDFNYNGVPDYTEGFYAIDSLQPIFIMGDDKNYNGILDKFEFSDKPDYGIDAKQKGSEYYLWYSPIMELEMQLGYHIANEYSGSKKIESFYYKVSYEKYLKDIFFVGYYNIASYIKKDLWVEDKGMIDGLDNDIDGYIDESDEVESVISNTGLYTTSFANRSLFVGQLKRLKGGLGAKLYIGGYYVNNLETKNSEFQFGNSGIIDFKKSFFDVVFYPFFKLSKIQVFSNPYDITKYYQTYLERNYGIIITYPIISKWNLKFGYINQLYDFNLSANDTKGSITLFELVGKPVMSGRTMVSKLGVEYIKAYNETRGSVDSAKFFVKLYFRM